MLLFKRLPKSSKKYYKGILLDLRDLNRLKKFLMHLFKRSVIFGKKKLDKRESPLNGRRIPTIDSVCSDFSMPSKMLSTNVLTRLFLSLTNQWTWWMGKVQILIQNRGTSGYNSLKTSGWFLMTRLYRVIKISRSRLRRELLHFMLSLMNSKKCCIRMFKILRQNSRRNWRRSTTTTPTTLKVH